MPKDPKKEFMENFPILNSLPDFTEKEREHIRDIAVAVWYFFGKPRGDNISDYFLPVELSYRLFKMNNVKKRLEFFEELKNAENILNHFKQSSNSKEK